MAAKGCEGPDLQRPHVRTGAFCSIDELASIQAPLQIDAQDRLSADGRVRKVGLPRWSAWTICGYHAKETLQRQIVDTARTICYIAVCRILVVAQ